jgi:hypothetical protein
LEYAESSPIAAEQMRPGLVRLLQAIEHREIKQTMSSVIEAVQDVVDWYDRDGSVGGCAVVIHELRKFLPDTSNDEGNFRRNYVAITESGEAYHYRDNLPPEILSACDEGIYDAIDITVGRKPLRYVAGEWKPIIIS